MDFRFLRIVFNQPTTDFLSDDEPACCLETQPSSVVACFHGFPRHVSFPHFNTSAINHPRAKKKTTAIYRASKQEKTHSRKLSIIQIMCTNHCGIRFHLLASTWLKSLRNETNNQQNQIRRYVYKTSKYRCEWRKKEKTFIDKFDAVCSVTYIFSLVRSLVVFSFCLTSLRGKGFKENIRKI